MRILNCVRCVCIGGISVIIIIIIEGEGNPQ